MRVSTRRCTRWSEEQARDRPVPGHEGGGEDGGGRREGSLRVALAIWLSSGAAGAYLGAGGAPVAGRLHGRLTVSRCHGACYPGGERRAPLEKGN